MMNGAQVVGAFLEVEVADDDGVSWAPAKVTELKDGGRFIACIRGEPDFVEEYGPEDEGSEWRVPASVRMVRAAYATAEAAYAAQQRAELRELLL